MPDIICPHCGAADFHRYGDARAFVDGQCRDADGNLVEGDAVLRCIYCQHKVTAEEAEQFAEKCKSDESTDGLVLNTIRVVTAFVSRLQYLVTCFERTERIDLHAEYEKMRRLFGRNRLNLAMVAICNLGHHAVPEVPVNNEVSRLITQLAHADRKDKVFYDFIVQAMDHTSHVRYRAYITLANQYVMQGWDRADKQ